MVSPRIGGAPPTTMRPGPPPVCISTVRIGAIGIRRAYRWKQPAGAPALCGSCSQLTAHGSWLMAHGSQLTAHRSLYPRSVLVEIAVVGSLNLDTTVRVAHLPSPGETVLGPRHFSDSPRN